MEMREARLCPICGGDSIVIKGRERSDGVFVRRRVCKECGAKYETLEMFSGWLKKPQKS